MGELPNFRNITSRSADSESGADLAVPILVILVFGLCIHALQFQRSLGEDDLYRVVNGLLDGARTGQGIGSPLHYGKAFSFGYIAALYRFADHGTLQRTQPLIALLNSIGFWAAVVGSAAFWISIRLLYSARVAAIAVTLFAFSPMMLDLGTSGHQILVAFALFALASILFFLPAKGLVALACHALGSLVLLGALASRAEIFLALPFLVLAGVDLRSPVEIAKSAIARSIWPALSLAAFFIVRKLYVEQAAAVSSASFFSEFYSLSNLPRGAVAYFVGCGFVTTVVGILASIWVIRATAAAAPDSKLRVSMLRMAVGPLSLILPAFLFWIANPLPSRHFILCLAGMSILAGLYVTSSASGGFWRAYFAAAAIVLANQGIGAVVGPLILNHYPTKLVTVAGRERLMPRLPLGSSWSYHRTAQAARWRTDAFAERILGTCETKTIVLSERQPQIVSHLFDGNKQWNIKERLWHGFTLMSADNEGTGIVVISLHEGWPRDAVADILADPSFDGYKLIRDPDTISVYDKTPIPQERAVGLGCGSQLASASFFQ
jgi:hypothetical protein